jgi:hypothetical protein
MPDEDVMALADGRSFFSAQALEMGLVDGVCSLAECIAMIADGSIAARGAKSVRLYPKAEPKQEDPPKTISANGGGTGPKGAGKTQVYGPGETKHMFKTALVRALSMLGMGQMATAVVASDSEEPEALAHTMANQVNAEVEKRLSDHPLLTACKVNGIHTAADLANTMDAKRLGDQYLVELRSDAVAEANRAYGELGNTISAQVATLSAASVKTMRDAWRAEADAKFGTKEKQPAGRQTAPPEARSADAQPAQDSKPKWDQLGQDQRDYAIKMGHTDPKKQEAFAAAYFESKEAA